MFGQSARDGLLSIIATKQGFTGLKRALEDPRGFARPFAARRGGNSCKTSPPFICLRLLSKPYPCARQLHAAVEALLRIMQRYGLKAERMDAIELRLPAPNASMVDRPSIMPTHAAAAGSGQYVTAVTALRGKIDLDSFDEIFCSTKTCAA